MTLPRTSALPAGKSAGELSGSWYEVTDPQGRVLYRRSIANPVAPEVELFHEDGSITRQVIERREVQFDVLIPDLPDAAKLELFSSEAGAAPPRRPGRAAGARRVASFRLDRRYEREANDGSR